MFWRPKTTKPPRWLRGELVTQIGEFEVQGALLVGDLPECAVSVSRPTSQAECT